MFPLRSYLDLDISLSGEEADMNMRKAIVMALSAVGSLKDLFFVKNIFESLKVSVFLFLKCVVTGTHLRGGNLDDDLCFLSSPQKLC